MAVTGAVRSRRSWRDPTTSWWDGGWRWRVGEGQSNMGKKRAERTRASRCRDEGIASGAWEDRTGEERASESRRRHLDTTSS